MSGNQGFPCPQAPGKTTCVSSDLFLLLQYLGQNQRGRQGSDANNPIPGLRSGPAQTRLAPIKGSSAVQPRILKESLSPPVDRSPGADCRKRSDAGHGGAELAITKLIIHQRTNQLSNLAISCPGLGPMRSVRVFNCRLSSPRLNPPKRTRRGSVNSFTETVLKRPALPAVTECTPTLQKA